MEANADNVGRSAPVPLERVTVDVLGAVPDATVVSGRGGVLAADVAGGRKAGAEGKPKGRGGSKEKYVPKDQEPGRGMGNMGWGRGPRAPTYAGRVCCTCGVQHEFSAWVRGGDKGRTFLTLMMRTLDDAARAKAEKKAASVAEAASKAAVGELVPGAYVRGSGGAAGGVPDWSPGRGSIAEGAGESEKGGSGEIGGVAT